MVTTRSGLKTARISPSTRLASATRRSRPDNAAVTGAAAEPTEAPPSTPGRVIGTVDKNPSVRSAVGNTLRSVGSLAKNAAIRVGTLANNAVIGVGTWATNAASSTSEARERNDPAQETPVQLSTRSKTPPTAVRKSRSKAPDAAKSTSGEIEISDDRVFLRKKRRESYLHRKQTGSRKTLKHRDKKSQIDTNLVLTQMKELETDRKNSSHDAEEKKELKVQIEQLKEMIATLKEPHSTNWQREFDLLKQEMRKQTVVPHNKFAKVTAQLRKIAVEAEKQVAILKNYVLKNNPKFIKEKSFWDSVIDTQKNLKRDAKKFHKLAEDFNLASKEVEELRTQFESHRDYLHELIAHIMRHNVQEKKK